MNRMHHCLLLACLLLAGGCSQEDSREVEEGMTTPGVSQTTKVTDRNSRTTQNTYSNVTFQSAATGRYLCSENGAGPMRLNRSEARSWEQFTVLDLGDRYIALQGNNGRYVNSENGERAMTCATPERRSWEVFRLVYVDDDQFVLRGNNGRYVRTDDKDYLWSTAAIEEAERFSVQGLPSSFSTINSVQIIKNDMILPHEGNPSGIGEGSNWYFGPRVGEGNAPPSPDWSAMTAWGQVYNPVGVENIVQNVRFQIRNIQAWYLSKRDGQWKSWQINQGISGSNYVEDFVDDKSITADIRDESANGGGISSTIRRGYNFHFWPAQRASMDPTDIAGIWIVAESRLIVDDPSLPDNRGEARLMLSMGGDYWQSLDAQWDQWKTNRDFGIGRFKFITPEWQAFNMHTLTEEQLNTNPPPFR